MSAVTFDMGGMYDALGRMEKRERSIPMDHFATYLMSAVDDVIQSEGKAGSDGAWAPFSPRTFKIHPRRIGGKLLQDTGALANVQVIDVQAQSVTVASIPFYAKFHQTGTKWMPKRDPFAVNFPKLLEEIAEDLLQQVVT